MIRTKNPPTPKACDGKNKGCVWSTFLIYHDTHFMSTENFNKYLTVDKMKL